MDINPNPKEVDKPKKRKKKKQDTHEELMQKYLQLSRLHAQSEQGAGRIEVLTEEQLFINNVILNTKAEYRKHIDLITKATSEFLISEGYEKDSDGYNENYQKAFKHFADVAGFDLTSSMGLVKSVNFVTYNPYEFLKLTEEKKEPRRNRKKLFYLNHDVMETLENQAFEYASKYIIDGKKFKIRVRDNFKSKEARDRQIIVSPYIYFLICFYDYYANPVFNESITNVVGRVQRLFLEDVETFTGDVYDTNDYKRFKENLIESVAEEILSLYEKITTKLGCTKNTLTRKNLDKFDLSKESEELKKAIKFRESDCVRFEESLEFYFLLIAKRQK